jgi:hypothetical protein
MALKKGSRFSANSDSVCWRHPAAEVCHDGETDERSESVVLSVQPRTAHSSGSFFAPYKVDRLAHSLADFAELVELFDRHSVSFVSVTQSLRLTLNVLLFFAQFEREVIGERVRDKIAASKRKGIWVGGPIPLGYRRVDKKLVVAPEEAETVQMIFRRYLELGAMGALMEKLDRQGTRTKANRLKKLGFRSKELGWSIVGA